MSIIINGETINKRNIQGLREIIKTHKGVAMVSDWTNGSGRHTTKRTVPPFCEEIVLFKDDNRHIFNCKRHGIAPTGIVGKALKRLLKEHPKVSGAIVCTDLRSANRALKAVPAN